jgi:hypothetical protein
VAEWLRRLTRNQIPSGSVGSSPTDRAKIINFFYGVLKYHYFLFTPIFPGFFSKNCSKMVIPSLLLLTIIYDPARHFLQGGCGTPGSWWDQCN